MRQSKRLTVEFLVGRSNNGCRDRNRKIIRVDPQQIQIEQRVDIGAKQETVSNRIRVLSEIPPNMSRFENWNEAATCHRAPVPIGIAQLFSKSALTGPLNDLSQHAISSVGSISRIKILGLIERVRKRFHLR